MTEECSICLIPLIEENSTTLDACGHTFHTECIITALRHSSQCPYCRDDPHKKEQEENDVEWMAAEAQYNQMKTLVCSVFKSKKLTQPKAELNVAVNNIVDAFKKCKNELIPIIEAHKIALFEKYKIHELDAVVRKKKSTYLRNFNKIAKEKNSELAPKINHFTKFRFLNWKKHRIVYHGKTQYLKNLHFMCMI